MNMMKKVIGSVVVASAMLGSHALLAADYVLDTKGMHAFVQFRIQHLGYSWLYGRFNDFDGTFSYDEKSPETSEVSVTIKTASVDSNHAERDIHLRDTDFLDVKKFPEATFVSTSYKPNGDGTGTLVGDFTLRGITKPLNIDVEEIGAGQDPWGGYRRGFQGSTKFALADFGIEKNLGPASTEVEIILSIEGIKK